MKAAVITVEEFWRAHGVMKATVEKVEVMAYPLTNVWFARIKFRMWNGPYNKPIEIPLHSVAARELLRQLDSRVINDLARRYISLTEDFTKFKVVGADKWIRIEGP